MNVVFDIGATRTRVAAVKDGQVAEPLVGDTPQNFDEAMALLRDRIRQASAGEEVAAVAGGVPGDIVDGRIVGDTPYLPQWDGGDIAGFLQGSFPGARIRVINDGESAALGEARTGAGRGYARVAYVGLGTGIGGDLCVQGALQVRDFKVGKQIMSGGQTLESLIGGHAVKERFGHGWEVLAPREYAEVLDTLAEGLTKAAEYWKPDITVLGGGISFARPSFLEDIRAKVPGLRLELALHKEGSGLWGASELLSD